MLLREEIEGKRRLYTALAESVSQGENRLVDDVANDLGMRQWMAIMSGRDITKGIKSKLKTHRHVAHC